MEYVREIQKNETIRTWEQIRWLGMITIQPHLKKGTTIKPHELIRFDWDTEKPARVQKKEEIQAMLERIAKRDKIDVQMTFGGEILKANGNNSTT